MPAATTTGSQAFVGLLLLAACGPGTGAPAPAPEPSVSSEAAVTVPDSIVHFLIASAARDFRAHRPPTVVDLRHARIGYILKPDSGILFVLCGEFLAQEEPGQWTDFTTIKTSDYEHYIGSTPYCAEATPLLSGPGLTTALKQQVLPWSGDRSPSPIFAACPQRPPPIYRLSNGPSVKASPMSFHPHAHGIPV